MFPVSWKGRLPCDHSGLLKPASEEATLLAGVGGDGAAASQSTRKGHGFHLQGIS